MKIWHLVLILLIAICGSAWGQVQEVEFSIQPEVFGENDTVEITVTGLSVSMWGVNDVYLWAWSYDTDHENPMDAPGNGTWDNSGESHKLDHLGEGVYRLTLVPTKFFNRQGIGRIGLLVKAKNGSGDKKSQDFLVEVGRFQIRLNQPEQTLTILDSAGSLMIHANTSYQAIFTLLANNDTAHTTSQPDSVYEYEYELTRNTHFVLQATGMNETSTLSFSAVIKPTVEIASLPDIFEDGINYHPQDSSSLVLVLYAPGKEWVHLISNLNDWQIDNNYLMKKDTARDRFWINLEDVDGHVNVLFQYLVEFTINIADPYSTLILDPHHDALIDSTIWPDLPEYPTGQTTEAVTWFRTNTPPYRWENDGFVPPPRENLIIYEILIRDFDERHSFDAVRERLDYLQDLGVNAIELMPVNEFDGNESWGYNPSFHSALDKYYGSPSALKRLIDECHGRGMAVILDVVFNHATGQNPYVRLWNDCNGCLDGKPTQDNPFFNENATHTYSVFHDFNHQAHATQAYVQNSISHWIREFRIDGFRWDLTKGFTQNCTGTNAENCTNSYQADRVEVLKSYADIQWNLNPDFLVIFEHLGIASSSDEEKEWARYRQDENLGILFWNNLNHSYSEAGMGYHDSGKSDVSRVYGPNRNLPVGAAISYMESHDEERLMYKMLEFGHKSGGYKIQSNSTALNRVKLVAAFFLTVPGPKLIWQFGELGYPVSINFNGRTGNKPIHWEYADNPERQNVYKTFQALMKLRQSSPAFTDPEANVETNLSGIVKDIAIQHPDMNVVITGNFGVTENTTQPHFSRSGKWYEYFSGDSILISKRDTMWMLNPGEFKVFTTRKLENPEEDILTYTTQDPMGGYLLHRPTLFPNYPNPFESETRIIYHLPASTPVTLDVFDIIGRKVRTLVDQNQQVGEHQVDFSAGPLRPGIYYVRLRTKNYTSVRKMICQ